MANYERNYGIDLLRLILMFMVCMLHTLGQGGILDASVKGTLEFNVYWLLETLCFCAVDGFAIISGYTASERPQRYDKIVNMWFQVFFYSFVVTALLTVIGLNSFNAKELIKCAFPVTFNKLWYFTAYFPLFFAIPMLNKFVFSIDEQTAKKALIILCILFSGLGIIADPFVTNHGYSALWLIVLYIIGALMKKIKLFEQRKSWVLIIVWLFCIFIAYFIYIYFEEKRLIDYLSPTILLSGMIMVVLFSRMKPSPKIISKLSPLAFGVFLLQRNTVLWGYIKNAFAFVAKSNIVIGLLYSFGIALVIFSVGLIVEFLRAKISKAIKIPSLSQHIVDLSNTVLTKLFVFLR